jgi:hypothetical protein
MKIRLNHLDRGNETNVSFLDPWRRRNSWPIPDVIYEDTRLASNFKLSFPEMRRIKFQGPVKGETLIRYRLFGPYSSVDPCMY